MDDNYWKTEKNIIFCTASENDFSELVTFIHENFLPHEPTNRMIKTVNGNTWLDKYLRDYLILTFSKIRYLISIPRLDVWLPEVPLTIAF